MLSKLLIAAAALVSSVNGVKLIGGGGFDPAEEGTGMSRPYISHTLEDDNNEIDLHAAVSDDDIPDTQTYAGEDIALEVADDHALNWKQGNRRVRVLRSVGTPYDNRDMW